MGMLIEGKWQDKKPDTTEEKFVREQTAFRNFITADGSSGFPAEKGRYHLYISYACPWACRTLIFRTLKKLEDVISLSIVDPLMGEYGWAFSNAKDCIPDEVNHADHLHQIYTLADPKYTGHVSVPVLWDKVTKTIVNNESAEIIRMLNSEFNAFTDQQYDYYPSALRNPIDEINKLVYENINNGVYRSGFAKTQEAYEEAFDQLFQALDHLEALLKKQRYLCGQRITESDWRLFTTLIRFDAVYVGHFKCNLRRIADYHNLQNYLRELYQQPGIADTVNMNHIKQHYYMSHIQINPNQIVPKGPLLTFELPHDRDQLPVS